MISIISVGYFSDDWEKLQRKSLEENTIGEYELLVHNNSKNNLGHAGGLNELIKKAKGEYILVLDIDAHILMKDWDIKVVKYFNDNGFSFMGARGGVMKPIRPACMFFRRDFILDGYDFSMVQVGDISFDVGIMVYWRTIYKQGEKKVGYFEWAKTKYQDVWGEEYTLNGERFAYHNYYGTRFGADKKELDGRTREDYLEAKDNLFNQYGREIKL